MSNKTIDFGVYQDPRKKDKMMIGLFELFEELDEPRPAFLDEMIKERSQEIYPKLRKAVLKEFRKHKQELFNSIDEHEILHRLLNLVHQEYRYALTYDEKDILGCSLEYHDMFEECWAWFEYDIATELMKLK